MTMLMQAGFSLLPRRERYPLPPRQIAMQVAEATGVRRELSERQKTLVTLFSHFLYGATTGAIYTLLLGRRQSSTSKGTAYGLLIWVASYLGWLPAAGILKPATDHPARRNLLMILAHLVWGATLGSLVRAAQRRSLDFRGRTVVIMGGSRGLGLELARQWVAQGAKVAICARTKADLQRARKELELKEGGVFAASCDITNKDQVESFIEKITDQWGRIDVLVNNAGVIQVGPLDCMTEEDYRSAMDTHYWGPKFAVDAVLPSMRRTGGGRIVNISSIGGKVSVPHLLPYSASKFALAGYSEGLAAELEQDNILVTTVYPGLMRTGSPRNALFKGQHRKEYAWFSISDSLPVLSINSARAARQIVEACRRGNPQLHVSLVCKGAVRLAGLLPGLTSRFLRVVNYCLPRSGGIGTKSKAGKESRSIWSPSPLTHLTERAAERNNEVRHNGARRHNLRQGR
jgi:NAD(P)-dependent dehydrogenase (short-subunit alcohol dehydrogenase family)/uncharacterized membrane protein YagU involved in acid resistance